MITTLFFDIGGVLLTNGWEYASRERAMQRFGLEPEEFERRHDEVVGPFERGEVALDEYLAHTVFHEPRPYSAAEFQEFLFACSEPLEEGLALARDLADAGRYRMVALNNESLELNLHRIRQFHLDRIFCLFCSSCFLGVAKPNPEIWRKALQLTQCRPEECLFFDDREENVLAARHVGVGAERYLGAKRLRQVLADKGLG